MNSSLPSRKRTRLKNYNYGNQGTYFLTICTKDRKNILSSITTKLVGDGDHDVPKTSCEYQKEVIPTVSLTSVGQIVEKYILSIDKNPGVFVDKYVIMPNHIHIILVIRNISHLENADKSGTSRLPSPTNQALPHVISTFKRFCNREIGENIFQRSYYDHIIRDEKDYETRVNYIYQNPMRWYYDELYTP